MPAVLAKGLRLRGHLGMSVSVTCLTPKLMHMPLAKAYVYANMTFDLACWHRLRIGHGSDLHHEMSC